MSAGDITFSRRSMKTTIFIDDLDVENLKKSFDKK